MNKLTLSLAAIALAASSSTLAQQEPGMKEQMKQDWKEIRDTAGEAAAGTAEVGRKAVDQGKKLGKKAKVKADEMTDKARQAAKGDGKQDDKEPSGKRFFY